MTSKNLEGITGSIVLPFNEAFWISVEQIKKRLKRTTIIISAIALGITLLTHLEMTNIIFAAYMQSAGVTIEAYQFWLIIVSLLVCVIGLINANLIAIYERYREIGTMKCLGALDRHIMKFFLIEAFIFGLVGGILGFAMGTLTALLSSSYQLAVNALFVIPLNAALQYFGLTMGLSIGLSIVSTGYPAIRAARLNPVEALRYDV